MRILWIDDDEWKSLPLKETLELHGHEIRFCPDCEEGYKELQKNPENYDVLMLDVMMPPSSMFENKDNNSGDITGLLFYKHIRNSLKELPILIYTVVRDVALLNKYLCDDNKAAWLNKPASAESIITKINNLI